MHIGMLGCRRRRSMTYSRFSHGRHRDRGGGNNRERSRSRCMSARRVGSGHDDIPVLRNNGRMRWSGGDIWSIFQDIRLRQRPLSNSTRGTRERG